jgi:nicotinate-nucleotide--dimethylbenzimidazole phosphoribosyltransferase
VGEGAGALLALPLVQAAAALAAELPLKPEELEESAEPEEAAEDEKPVDLAVENSEE